MHSLPVQHVRLPRSLIEPLQGHPDDLYNLFTGYVLETGIGVVKTRSEIPRVDSGVSQRFTETKTNGL